jgi:Zn finger protein HypA/HybF involved in hydrogenase expression
LVGFTSLTRTDLARWLYGGPAIFGDYLEKRPERARKIERVRASFVDVDGAARDWAAAAAASGAAGSPSARILARRQRAEATVRRVRARTRLEAFLRYGLQVREGSRLHGEESVWIHLVARRITLGRLRVCEQCALVFAAPRARRCTTCRSSPLRISLHPVYEGGWHLDYQVGSRFYSEPFDRTVYYTTRCEHCQRPFVTTRPHRRLCRNCGDPAGRVRRHRGSPSLTGRRRYRFTHAEGAEDFTVSALDNAGKTLMLSSTDGVIETADAEVANVLDANHSLRRLD